ncbi:MAG: hypothetical protein AB1529_07175 [Candidatus Micrarchaeota archaeon]
MILRPADAVLHSSGRFRGYRPMKEQAARSAEGKTNERLGELVDVFSSVPLFLGNTRYEEIYDSMLVSLEGLRWSPDDVARFVLEGLPALGSGGEIRRRAGLFVSALVNNGSGSDYALCLDHLEWKVSMLGYRNMRALSVKGDAGAGAGYEMLEGSLKIDGCAGDFLACRMEGGVLVLNGDAGRQAAWGIIGGEVHVDGGIETLGTPGHGSGRIFHKGRMVWPNGG